MVQLLVIVVVQGVVVGTVGIIFLVQFLIASNNPGRVNKKKNNLDSSKSTNPEVGIHKRKQ